MMSRDKLLKLRAQMKATGAVPTREEAYALIDHGLAALDELAGGVDTIAQREALKTRERQLLLAINDVRIQVAEIMCAVPADVEPAIVEGEPLIRDLQKVRFTIDLAEEMLKAKGPAWQREWNWYTPRIAEEFE